MTTLYPQRRSLHQSGEAFSLIEVIIAVSVISILAALSLPVLQMVAESSNKTRCLNNLRQLGMAFQSYANDNNGLLPRTDMPVANSTTTIQWPYVIERYLQIDFLQASRNYETFRRTPFWCPSEKTFSTPELGRIGYTYAINRELNERLYGTASHIRQSQVRSPGSYAVLADAFYDRTIYTDTRQKMLEMTRMTRRHNSMPNFLYADWHVAPFSREIYGLSDAAGREQFYQRLWKARYDQ
jgi:prepilin-type N-terminal cleavage/methylation domain-containing protein/prepilin-type processing-associated H-X9-DG protein